MGITHMGSIKASFLLSRSVALFSESANKYFYDARTDLNYFSIYGMNVPVATIDNNVTTHSKTFAAPGDDDPDSEAESCY